MLTTIGSIIGVLLGCGLAGILLVVGAVITVMALCRLVVLAVRWIFHEEDSKKKGGDK